MSRLLLTIALGHLALAYSTAQDARLFNQVVASTGTFAKQQGLNYSYTVGELVIPTLSVGNFTLTEGFHQPEHTKIVSVDEPGLADWNIEVFPNPVSDRLTVRFSPEKGSTLFVSIFNLLGEVIFERQSLPEPSGSPIDCTNWQPGVYLLQITDSQSRSGATVRIVRF